MTKQILNITLDDLFGLLTPEETLKVMEKISPPPSPWTASARVLVLVETVCDCGSRFLHPGAPDLLVRYIGKGGLHERSSDPLSKDTSLPIETRTLGQKVHVCASCVHESFESQELRFSEELGPLDNLIH